MRINSYASVMHSINFFEWAYMIECYADAKFSVMLFNYIVSAQPQSRNSL